MMAVRKRRRKYLTFRFVSIDLNFRYSTFCHSVSDFSHTFLYPMHVQFHSENEVKVNWLQERNEDILDENENETCEVADNLIVLDR
jgi:hypothetical protein